MLSEPVKIILRRFRDRLLESGLLVIAVALGIGAFSSGISLLLNTYQASAEMMKSPSYREIVVSTRSKASDMNTPVIEKPVEDTAVLTVSDLSAAEVTPSIAQAYVQNMEHLRIITSDFIEQNAQRKMQQNTEDPPPEGGNFFPVEDIEKAALDADIVQAEVDELFGYEVTPDFFDAWEIEAETGSLFSESDLTSTDNLIVLGSDLAALLAGDETAPRSLLGRKLLTVEGYQTIIGILGPVSDDYDYKYFAPYKDLSGSSGGFRRMSMNTQLRFTVADPAMLESTTSLLTDWFENRFGEDQIVITNPRVEAEQLVKRNTGIGLLILFLSAAGFFIALVNVSNILMSRVIRMKKNVGVLMALGSTRKGITRLFLTEALLISVVGALIGALLAFPLSSYMQTAVDIGSSSWFYVLAGALISCALTVVFGIIPSRQFMKIDPAQAMRTA